MFIKSLFLITALLTFASCATTKRPNVSDAREPGDLPPSPRYTAILMALRDELPRHPNTGEFYLCQSREQVAALQRDLPGFTLRHASETYTAPVQDWPSLIWSHRLSDDALATRVILDIESQAADTITTVLCIGHPSANLTQVRHTFRRQGSSWTLLRREEGTEIRI